MDLVKAVVFFSLLFQFFSPLKINGQIKIETELHTLFQPTDTTGQKFSKPLKDASNEFEILVSTGFLVYKTTISSQDKPSCIFSPSCSEYAVESFQRKGIFIGWLQTFDRLSRCHGLVNHTHYHFDQEKNRFYDPVQ